MIIAFTIIALITISWLSIGIYAIFIPFLQNIWTIQQYNSAYYGAMIWIERALLVSKQQEFWFNGSWWRDTTTSRWPISDQNNGQFGLLSEDNNGIQRSLQWQTNNIPKENQSNITSIFQTATNNNYNNLSYNQDLSIRLQTNQQNDPEKYYTTEQDIQNFQWTQIQTHIRLPEKIGWLLCDTCDQNDDGISDDIIALRQIKWEYNNKPFTIIPQTDTDRATSMVWPDDMHIRESTINNTTTNPLLLFWLWFNPLKQSSTIIQHDWFGEWFRDIQTTNFQSLRQDNWTNILTLHYQIIQHAQNNEGFVYPFLEYYIESDDMISDTYRYITGQGKVNPYQVNVQIKKPQQQWQVWSYFSIIF